MFSFHSRSRSLIPVAAIKDAEKCTVFTTEVEDIEEPRHHISRQHVLIYLLFLADAIMQASLTSQTDALLSTDSSCFTVESQFVRSILQASYCFGSAMGLVWGMAADRFGRRRIALLSLSSSLICCLSMGFASSLGTFALLRALAGAAGSAAPISGLAMLADTTTGTKQRTAVIARLPVVAVCGQIGPLLSSTIKHFTQDRFQGVFISFPALGGQATCALLVLAITIVEALLLEETLPTMVHNSHDEEEYIDCEKAAFLGQSFSNESQDSLTISVVDTPHDDAAISHISISQLFTAPSVMLLLASFSALSLHSSIFDALLPHLGRSTAEDIGLGLPCSWLQLMMLVITFIAASCMLYVPTLVRKYGLVPLYRKISYAFPAFYLVLPVVALAANSCGDSVIVTGTLSTLAALLKAIVVNAAEILVVLLALSAAPDASSTGALIGCISISQLFKTLAVGSAGVSYFLADEYSLLVVNGCMWAVLATIATLGAVMTRRLREKSRVALDLPEECFVWQGIFDADADEL